jgi:mRNA-degrading endonuclease RelE of RelBE toxin-antitoxin system
MRYIELNSFEKSFKKLSEKEKKQVKKALLQLIVAFEKQLIPPGMGLKKLTTSLWKLRVGLKLRVIFILKQDIVELGFVGTHKDILKFIKGSKR